MTDTTFKTLEDKVDSLIQLCAEMKSENQNLREQQHSLQTERTNLLNKNQMAKARLEKVLVRLKSMQQEA
jgi:cell division protein ZapB